MNIQDIKTFLRTRKKLDELSSNIFNYVKDKHSNHLKFFFYSSYGDCIVNEKYLSIEYYYTGYGEYDDDYLPDIPIELLKKESLWKNFLTIILKIKQKKKCYD